MPENISDKIEANARTDVLLALAVAFSRSSAADATGPSLDSSAVQTGVASIGLPGSLSSDERQSMEKRLQWLEQKSPDELLAWVATVLRQTLAGIGPDSGYLDESIHQSHVLAALQREPNRIRMLILQYLPRDLATALAKVLELRWETEQTADDSDQERTGCEPVLDARLIRVVRRAFLSNFITAEMLSDLRQFDLLSNIELARLIRLLGVQQTAIACRGVTEAETVASFLQHFSAEDSAAIARHMLATEAIEARWVEFAQQLVQSAMNSGAEGATLLEQVGLSLLAAVLAGHDMQRRRYTQQKLPLDVSHKLEAMISDCEQTRDTELEQVLADDVETISRNLRSHFPALAVENQPIRPMGNPECSNDTRADL